MFYTVNFIKDILTIREIFIFYLVIIIFKFISVVYYKHICYGLMHTVHMFYLLKGKWGGSVCL
jgi:hypothetical protein